MKRTLTFSEMRIIELANLVYENDLSGIDFSIPQHAFDVLMKHGFDRQCIVMSYKGGSTFGRLENLAEKFLIHLEWKTKGITHPNPRDYRKEGDFDIPEDMQHKMLGISLDTRWWVMRLSDRTYKPVNIAYEWACAQEKEVTCVCS